MFSADAEMRNFGRVVSQKKGTLDPNGLNPNGFLESRPVPDFLKKKNKTLGPVRESTSAGNEKPPTKLSKLGGTRRQPAEEVPTHFGSEEVDFNNIRKSWKPRTQLLEESARRRRARANCQPPSRRAFPGPIRQSLLPPDGAVTQYMLATDPHNKRMADTFNLLAEEEERREDEKAMRMAARKKKGGPGEDFESLMLALSSDGSVGSASFASRRSSSTLHEEVEDEETRLRREAAEAQLKKQQLLQDPEYLKLDESELPIEIFDSLEYQNERDKTPQEWLASKSEASVPYFLEGKWRWRRCRVLAYDAQTAKFTVQFLPQGRVKDVKRLNLQFDREDKVLWEKRRQFAYEEREKTKSYLRFDHFVANQPNESVRAVQKAWLRGIHERVADGLPPNAPFPDQHTRAGVMLRKLTADAIQDYTRVMKKAVLHYQLLHDHAVAERYNQLHLPPVPPKLPPPRKGKVKVCNPDGDQMPADQFEYHLKRVQEIHYSNYTEVLATFMWLYSTWDRLFAAARFMDLKFSDESGSLQLPCRILEFQAHQSKACSTLERRLTEEWRRNFMEQLQDNLQGVYDVLQGNLSAYTGSPLFKLLKHLELRMGSQLRSLLDASLVDWEDFVEQFTEQEWSPQAAEEPSHFIVTGRTSLFEMSLLVDADTMSLELEPSPDEVERTFLKPITDMIKSLETFMTVDSELMSLLKLDSRRIFDPSDKMVFGKIKETERHIKMRLEQAFQGPRALMEAYEGYTQWLLQDPDELVESFFGQDPPPEIEELVVKVREFHVAALEVQRLTFDCELFSLCRLDTTGAKHSISEKLFELRNALISRVISDCRNQSYSIIAQYEAILQRVAERPNNEQELASLREFIISSKAKVAELVGMVSSMHQTLASIEEFLVPLDQEDLNLMYHPMEFPIKVDQACKQTEEALEIVKMTMMDKLMIEKGRFDELLETFEMELKRAKALSNYDQMESNTDEVTRLQNNILEAKKKAEDFNMREKVFGFTPTEYATLNSVETELEPFYKLWNMISEFHASQKEWLFGPFQDLKAAEIDSNVTDWWKTSYKLSRTLEEHTPGAAACAARLREETTIFKEHLPVIRNLASKALKPRHWISLSDKMGVSIEVDEDLTLQGLLDMKAADFIEEIQEICVAAEKEFGLENNLQAMKEEWNSIEFEVKPYKDTYLVGGIDEIISLLDDHIVKTQTMRGSPFIKAIEEDAKKWEHKLKYAQGLLDQWIKCQRTWMYLEPIFSSEDIMRQLPTEARRFQAVDQLWKKTLAETQQDARFLVQAEQEKKLLDKFTAANQKLDEIQKGLNDYLEVKRLYFPRFFFLSNDELLEILSQTKEPKAVQRHLGKAFEGINKVKFEADLKISEMISAQGEVVKLDGFIDPESSGNKGNVERWLLELEAMQWQSVKTQTESALASYVTKARTLWSLDWPAQVVLAVSQIYWTQEIINVITKGEADGLKKELEKETSQLMDIVQLVRGKLNKLQRSTLGALVVIDIHAKEVVSKLIEGRVTSSLDFLWMRELRYYWEVAWKDGQAVKKGQKNCCVSNC